MTTEKIILPLISKLTTLGICYTEEASFSDVIESFPSTEEHGSADTYSSILSPHVAVCVVFRVDGHNFVPIVYPGPKQFIDAICNSLKKEPKELESDKETLSNIWMTSRESIKRTLPQYLKETKKEEYIDCFSGFLSKCVILTQ